VLESLEAAATDLRPPLALLAGQGLALEEDELHGARRRALLLLAAGGDPERGLVLDGRAVTALADELDTPERRATLSTGLEELRQPSEGLAEATAALEALLDDSDLAWRAFACALLAEEIGGG
jgi:uncharacterized protein YbjT (DUF2867 family)